MYSNQLLGQIQSIPGVMRSSIPELGQAVHAALDPDFARSLERIFVCGCGDSHHAALTSELAFETLAGIPTQAMTSMHFARYTAQNLPQQSPANTLVIGISVSGEVARTIEALQLGRAAGASTLALTSSPTSRLAAAAQYTLRIPAPAVTPSSDLPVPGSVTYVLNQLVLFRLGIVLGQNRGVLTQHQASEFRGELEGAADTAQRTIQSCSKIAGRMAESWLDENEYVFTGAGPNFGTALFSAAKLLEASGDFALGQDLEEWAHLQYFARIPATPTFVICSGGRDLSRAVEIIQAARGIGRQVAAVTSLDVVDMAGGADFWLPMPDKIPEIFSSLITYLPGALFAAYRAELLGEPYFRDFGGGRNPEEGGGLSRIQTSRMLEDFDS
jgi:glucosamine--fructose-6-phosphate aminotransferase (isomerizing)